MPASESRRTENAMARRNAVLYITLLSEQCTVKKHKACPGTLQEVHLPSVVGGTSAILVGPCGCECHD